jgi:pimeloyl-ACP methyl ester carboxylesterase
MTPWIKTLFKTANALSPKLAGWAAYKLFSTPLKVGRLSDAEKRLEARAEAKLQSAEQIFIQSRAHRIAAYRFSNEPQQGKKRIILVHGWMSGARFMLAIADHLLRQGHEVICFDLPAHGASSGTSTNLVECAAALTAVIDHFGTVDSIIAHSFGGAVTAFAVSQSAENPLTGRGEIVLLASPNRLTEVTKFFARQLGVSDAARLDFEARLCAPMQAPIAAMDGNLLYAQTPNRLHVIHCRDDGEVSVEEGRRFQAMGNHIGYTELSGLGHRRILYADSALDAIEAAILAG